MRVEVDVLRYGARELGGLLQACRCGGMELGSSGGPLQACRRGEIELWRRDIRVWTWSLPQEFWSSGGTLRASRRGGMRLGSSSSRAAGVHTWRYGARELWRRADSTAWSSGALQSNRVGVEEWKLWSRAVGAQTWRYGARELGRHTAGVQACRRGGIEVWSSEPLEARYWRSDIEVPKFGGALKV